MTRSNDGWAVVALIVSASLLLLTLVVYFVLADDPLRDLVRAVVLFVGLSAITSCLVIIILFSKGQHPLKRHILAIGLSWVVLQIAAMWEVGERWGTGLTWRWVVSLAASIAGLWGFWHLTGAQKKGPRW